MKNMAPQVGFEPTTLRLTAREIYFSSVPRAVATQSDLMRYVAVFQAISPIASSALCPRGSSETVRDYDPGLDTVGKEMGKVSSSGPERRVAERSSVSRAGTRALLKGD
jgi:hypothetical protein